MSYQQYRPSGFKVLPPVVKNILVITILMYFATWVVRSQFGIDLNFVIGLHYFKSEFFSPYQLITYIFLHGGIAHIFMNLFAVWMFGSVLENLWGGKRFLAFYLLTGIGAALTHMTVEYFRISNLESIAEAYFNTPNIESFSNVISDHFPIVSYNKEAANIYREITQGWSKNLDAPQLYIDSSVRLIKDLISVQIDQPTVGASGSLFGILLAFGMLFPNTLLFFIFFPIPIKAKYFVAIYGLMELFSGVANRPGDNVAHFAHLGGMLFGFILIKYWRKNSNNFY